MHATNLSSFGHHASSVTAYKIWGYKLSAGLETIALPPPRRYPSTTEAPRPTTALS